MIHENAKYLLVQQEVLTQDQIKTKVKLQVRREH